MSTAGAVGTYRSAAFMAACSGAFFIILEHTFFVANYSKFPQAVIFMSEGGHF
jgi:hypothetical protein